MSIEELKKREDKLRSQIANLNSELSDVRNQMAKLQAKFSIGDKVTLRGKDETYIISRIAPWGYSSTPEYYGRKIKKDGNPGEREVRIYEWRPGDLQPA